MKYLISVYLLVFLYSCSNLGIDSVNSLAKLGEFRSVDDLPYSEHKMNSVDLYIPKIGSYENPLPVVVFFYGGCWGNCVSYYKEDYIFVADALTELGYIVVIANYRMYPEVTFNTIIDDAQKSVEWTRENIDLFFGDRENIFIMGHSSGAHLAVLLSLNEEYLNTDTRSALRGSIGLSGPYDFLPYTEDYLPKIFGPQEDAAYSQPINFVHKNETPLLLMYGKDDKVIKEKNIINLSKKIRDINESITEKHYEGLDHQGIMSAFSRPLRNETLLSDIDKFIRLHIK